MGKVIWIIILVIVIVLLWFLFRGDSSSDTPADTTEDAAVEANDNPAAAVATDGEASGSGNEGGDTTIEGADKASN